MEKNDSVIQKLSEDVSYLRGRFDTAIPMMQKSAEDINNILKGHEEKLDALSKVQSNMQGRMVVLGSIAGAVVSIIGKWFTPHIS